MFTIAAAGSRGRLSIVSVEAIARQGNRYPELLVFQADTLPQDATPYDQYDAVLAAEVEVKKLNLDPDLEPGAEPLVIVDYGGVGTSLNEFLRNDWRDGKRAWRPRAYTHLPAANDGRAVYVTLNRMAANLALQWKENRLTFAPGLDSLRKQMRSFSPIETRGGKLALEDEADLYPGEVVALMYALAHKGEGVRRYRTSDGVLWRSRAEAVTHRGQAAA